MVVVDKVGKVRRAGSSADHLKVVASRKIRVDADRPDEVDNERVEHVCHVFRHLQDEENCHLGHIFVVLFLFMVMRLLHLLLPVLHCMKTRAAPTAGFEKMEDTARL